MQAEYVVGHGRLRVSTDMVKGGAFALKRSANRGAAAWLTLKSLDVKFVFYASINAMVLEATRKMVRDDCRRLYVKLILNWVSRTRPSLLYPLPNV